MIAGILLAAGGARRFHSQKLVAPLDGVPVVRHSALALGGCVDRLLVVVGSEAAAGARAVADPTAQIVENRDWELGLASSLRAGIAALAGDVDAAVVALGDQPRLDPALIGRVLTTWRTTGKPIVSASYRGVRAHPVLFARALFGELLQLDGDAGARLLIERTPERVAYVDVDTPMPLDVDIPGDLDLLRSCDD